MRAPGRAGRVVEARSRARDSPVGMFPESRRSPRHATRPRPGSAPPSPTLPRASRPPAATPAQFAISPAASAVTAFPRYVSLITRHLSSVIFGVIFWLVAEDALGIGGVPVAPGVARN